MPGVIADTAKVLINTFFQTSPVSLDSSDSSEKKAIQPTPEEWLQHKDHYKAVWFSYEYYDKTLSREEGCEERIIVGEQCLLLSPDVLHRVWFFVDKFLTSLEAVPLFSKGIIAIIIINDDDL